VTLLRGVVVRFGIVGRGVREVLALGAGRLLVVVAQPPRMTAGLGDLLGIVGLHLGGGVGRIRSVPVSGLPSASSRLGPVTIGLLFGSGCSVTVPAVGGASEAQAWWGRGTRCQRRRWDPAPFVPHFPGVGGSRPACKERETMQKRTFSTRLAVIAGATALVAAFALPSTAGAQDTTDVWVVHGLNLAGQDSVEDGGTNVTVCAGNEALIPDFQFGAVVGPVALPSGEPVNIRVLGEGGADCADEDLVPIIDEEVTPEGAAAALVAVSQDGTLGLLAAELNVTCAGEGEGRLTAVHASGDTGPVDVLVDGETLGTVAFATETTGLSAPLPAGAYEVEVRPEGEEDPVVGPAEVPVAAGENTVVFVVGNITGDTPVVPIITAMPLDCPEDPDGPGDTTTTVPGTQPGDQTTVTPVGPGTGAAPLTFTG